MTMEIKNRTTKTCKFLVKGNETLGLEKIVIRTNSTIVLNTTEDTTKIGCAKNVFYPIRVCYLVSEERKILFSKNYDALAEGNCVFEVSPGEWTCGFNGPNAEDKDFVQNFRVFRHNKVISGFTISDDGSLTMKCHLFNKNPIKVCMFVSPSGKVLRPTTNQFQSDQFSYYKGGTFREGDCVINFKTNHGVETGYWNCLLVKMNDEELSEEIYVPR